MLDAIAAVLIAAAAPAAGVRLAAVGLQGADVDGGKLDFFTEYLAQKLSDAGASVTTPAAVQAVLGLERQRQLLGCGEQGAGCLVEISGALGVDGIIVGSIARVGSGYAANLKVVKASDGATLAAETARTASEDELLDFLSRAATRMASELSEKLGRPWVARSARAGRGAALRPWAVVPAGVGLAAAVASAVLFALSVSSASRLNLGDATVGDRAAAERLAQSGQSQQTAGWGLAVGAGVSWALAAVLLVVGGALP